MTIKGLIAWMKKVSGKVRGWRDLVIINRRANRLNEEAVDVLAYQVRLDIIDE